MSLTVCTAICAEDQRCGREIAAPFAAIAKTDDVVIRYRSPFNEHIFPGISTPRTRSRWCTLGPSGPEGLSELTAAGIGDQKPVRRPPDLVAPVRLDSRQGPLTRAAVPSTSRCVRLEARANGHDG